MPWTQSLVNAWKSLDADDKNNLLWPYKNTSQFIINMYWSAFLQSINASIFVPFWQKSATAILWNVDDWTFRRGSRRNSRWGHVKKI